eukprot:6182918-Pleurochrysis_carterae.AAC.1
MGLAAAKANGFIGAASCGTCEQIALAETGNVVGSSAIEVRAFTGIVSTAAIPPLPARAPGGNQFRRVHLPCSG